MMLMTGGTGWGNQNAGGPFPPRRAAEADGPVASKWNVRRHDGGKSLTRSWLLDDYRAAVFAAGSVG